MKKNGLIGLVLAAAVMGGCAESDVSGDVRENGEGTAVSAIAEDEVMSLAESMASDMAESMFESMAESEREAVSESVKQTAAERKTEAETEDTRNFPWEYRRTLGLFVRTSEEESKTVTIESDVFPYDSEEITINIDTERPYYNDIEPYDCIDLTNLKNYPNLKSLRIGGNMYSYERVRLINWDGAAGLENLEEIFLSGVIWDEDGLANVSSLKTLTIQHCYYSNWDFLGKLPQVETLSLRLSGVNDLSFINGMDSLTELTLEHNSLNNTSFNGLEENYSVKRLTTDGNSEIINHDDNDEIEYTLTDIMGFGKLRGLEYMSIGEENLADKDKQKEKLQAELPNCEIIIY